LKVKKMQELEQRIALVVGNNDYDSFVKLKNPINDARAMRDSLKRKKFEVIYLENVSQKKFKRAIKKFTNKLSAGGVGLFYFAGHGIQVNGENFLIPSDADIADRDDVDGESVPIAYLTKKLKKAGNRLNIIILDACRSKPWGRGGGGFPTGLKWAFVAEEESDQKYVICNADEGDPGAFMDRAVLEGDPHSVIEGMQIAAFATGATKGIIYIRHL
jgi:uncharacterized caspase-like protein